VAVIRGSAALPFSEDELFHEVDLTIRWGMGDWPAAKIELLVPVRLQPICSPALAGSGLLFSDVQNRPPTLLHVRDRDDWRDWLEHVGLPTGLADSGPVFDEPNVCIEAAASGLGFAMGFFPSSGPSCNLAGWLWRMSARFRVGATTSVFSALQEC
jgi:DNA-binding transcriptional LysR family regulator